MTWAIKTFKMKFYFCDIWNVVDWLHFTLMWIGWYCWLVQMRLLSVFEMPTYFVIINSPTANAVARLFLTKPKGESDYLIFHDALKTMIYNMGTYNTITSLCGNNSCVQLCMKLAFVGASLFVFFPFDFGSNIKMCIKFHQLNS